MLKIKIKKNNGIKLIFSLFILIFLISNTYCQEFEYIGVCEDAKLEYKVTKDHQTLGYNEEQTWVINVLDLVESQVVDGSTGKTYDLVTIKTQGTGDNISDLFNSNEIYIYENESLTDSEIICTGDIKWIIHKNLGNQNHTFDGTSLKYDSNGVLEKGILNRTENLTDAIYTITISSLDLGNCGSTISGFSIGLSMIYSLLGLTVLVLRKRN